MSKALSTRMKEVAARTAPAVQSNGLQLKFANHQLEVGGTTSKSVNGIIVSDMLERTYYSTAYDPNKVTPPDCYAFSNGPDPMVPHEDAANPQASKCDDCPQSQWGSAGRGKACKERIRFGFVPVGETAEEIRKAPIAYARAPVTSTSNWGSFQQALKAKGLMLPLQAKTDIQAGQHPKWGNVTEVTYEITGPVVGDELIEALLDRSSEADLVLHEPYAAD